MNLHSGKNRKPNQVEIFLSLLLTGFVVSGCNYRELKGGPVKVQASGNIPTFAQLYSQVLQPKCLNCHGAVETHLVNFMTYDQLIRRSPSGTVVAGDPENSQLFQKISGADPEMPLMRKPLSPSSVLTAAETQLVYDWIKGGALEIPGASKPIAPPSPPTPPNSGTKAISYRDLYVQVLKPKCSNCHGGVQMHEMDVTNYEELIKSRFVKVGDGDNSGIFQEVDGDDPDMPQMGEQLSPKTGLTLQEKKMIHDWIDQGAKP